MAYCMEFPDDWHDFLKSNQFIDSKEVYTNGSELIQVYRVEQLIEHLLKEQEAVEPVKTCASKSELGVDGLLIVGNCPVCGQSNINNRDNKFCGGCGRPIYWTRITNKYGLLKGR